jgi:hypothetical protein
MSTFEVLIVVLNAALVSANLFLAWVMVQQRRLMDEQLAAMQAQLREAERTRIAAHRPVLRVEPPILVPTAPPLPPVELFYLRNIGVGVALNVEWCIHQRGTGVVWVDGSLDPVGAGELSRELFIPYPQELFALNAALTVTYADVFGNRYWTLSMFENGVIMG